MAKGTTGRDGEEKGKGVKRKKVKTEDETNPGEASPKVKKEAREVKKELPVKAEDATSTDGDTAIKENAGVTSPTEVETKSTTEASKGANIESRFQLLGKHLGEGTYGQVVKALDTLTGR